MLYLLGPRRCWPLARLSIGAILVVVGIVIASTVALVIGGAFIVWGAITGINHLRTRPAGDDQDKQPPP